MPRETEIKVRGYHLDIYSHVNNARYLEFLEEARWVLLEDHIDEMAAKGYAFFVVNINISYKSPAAMGDVLLIDTRLSKLGGKSGTFTQVITRKGEEKVVAEADVTFVVAGADGKLLPMAGELKKTMMSVVA